MEKYMPISNECSSWGELRNMIQCRVEQGFKDFHISKNPSCDNDFELISYHPQNKCHEDKPSGSLVDRKAIKQIVENTMMRYEVSREKAVEYLCRALFDGDVIHNILDAIHDEWRYDNKRGVK